MKLNHQAITKAIQEAEKNTSGEILVVVSGKKTKNIFDEAQKAFEKVGLTQTKDHNAVLFYIAEKSHQFAVLGDEGIHAVVQQEFWDELRDILAAHFQIGKFTEGLCRAIEMCGVRLKMNYPYISSDVNELSDEVRVF